MIGKHNVLNALSALAVARVLELDLKDAAAALESYKGVDRRMTLHFDSDDLKVYDDYAHNPGKMAACLVGIKEAWPDHTLHAIYQAHRYSRLDTMFTETMSAFASADAVTVLPVYAAGETAKKEYTPQSLARDIARLSHVQTFSCESLENCAADLVNSINGPTVLITLGAGDIWKVSVQLGELCDEKRRRGQGYRS
jgi:UDP-N-acetylmuramate--alanine ligase